MKYADRNPEEALQAVLQKRWEGTPSPVIGMTISPTTRFCPTPTASNRFVSAEIASQLLFQMWATAFATTLETPLLPPCVTFRRVAVSLRGPGQSPARPFACCAGHCVLSAAAACVPAVVVFALAEPSSWRTGVVLIAAGVGGRPLLPTPLRILVIHCRHEVPQVAVSSRGPGQSPILPCACYARSLYSNGRCGLCSCVPAGVAACTAATPARAPPPPSPQAHF